MAEPADPLHHETPRWLKPAALLALCIIAIVVLTGIISRMTAGRNLNATTGAADIPLVTIITPTAGTGDHELVLPGTIRAYYEAPIYAQVSGYLQRWYADIGAQVKGGQLLATIETPDLDQQLIQARADLATAAANQKLAASTARRWNALLAKDAVSQQDADEKNADYAAQTAAMNAAQANVNRLLAQEGFKRITAPFDGFVTSRSTDIGALITVGTPNQTPLFTVDDEHLLRIYVNVPQAYAAAVKPGTTASFTVPEYPGQSFSAALSSTAQAISPATGTLLVEFQADNADHRLRPGAYAQVHIPLAANPDVMTIPSSALMFRNSGMEVALVGADDRVSMLPVTITRDFGATVEIAEGLSPQDDIINNPPDSLQQGDKVQIVSGNAQE